MCYQVVKKSKCFVSMASSGKKKKSMGFVNRNFTYIMLLYSK